MIQRIQTLFLLVVAILMGSLYFFPIAQLFGEQQEIYEFYFNGLRVLGEQELYVATWPTFVLLSVIVFISFFSIFLFRKRVLQMRVNLFNIVLMLGYLGLNYFYIQNFDKQMDGKVVYQLVAVFPVISVIFTYLAIRSIGKDEALIRSIDRIR
jgi:hypothetical protein